MPAYNVEPYIEEAIESVISQTVLPLELIIVNDGSTDGTANVIASYSNNPIIKVITTENRGLGPARNLGREHARGEYIYFFDSDDLLPNNFIELINMYILMYGLPDLILFSGKTFYEKDVHEKKTYNSYYLRKIANYYNCSDSLLSDLFLNDSLAVSACLYVSKKSVWDNGLKFKPIVHEDNDIFLPLIANTETSLVIKDILFFRRIRNNSIMTTPLSIANLYGRKEIINSYLEFWKGEKKKFNKSRPAFRYLLLSQIRQYTKIAETLNSKKEYSIILKAIICTKSVYISFYVFYNFLPKSIKVFLKNSFGVFLK